MISGFQNFLHLTLGLPNGWTRQEQTDGFIPISGQVRRKRRKEVIRVDTLRTEIGELLAMPARQQAQQRRLEKLLLLLAYIDD